MAWEETSNPLFLYPLAESKLSGSWRNYRLILNFLRFVLRICHLSDDITLSILSQKGFLLHCDMYRNGRIVLTCLRIKVYPYQSVHAGKWVLGLSAS